MDIRKHICARFCRYFKPDKFEDPGCGGFERLKRDPELLAAAASLDDPGLDPLYALDRDLPQLRAVCDACEFLVDGCDFRDPEVPDSDCSPCGGLIALAGLVAAGKFREPPR